MHYMPALMLVTYAGICSQAQAGNASMELSGLVTVPVLVETNSGELAYDLAGSDFVIKDNGLKQRTTLNGAMERTPLSLVLVIQTGHGGAAQLQTTTHVNGLLDTALAGPDDQIAIIGFDGRPEVLQQFTSDSGEITSTLVSITAGDSGAALFDGMHLALGLLQAEPKSNRKMILLVSGEHDHGSNASDIGSLVRDISASDVSVYSLCFRAGRKSLLEKLGSLNPMAALSNAVQENAAEALAQMTGGEFYRFDSKKEFEDRSIEIASHINNRYELSFHPSDPKPGFHSLQVEVNDSRMNVIAARSGYWVPDPGRREGQGIEK
jgi:Ca-activated chloride channel family protein